MARARIDLAALARNWQTIANECGGAKRTAAVVKADGYGCGAKAAVITLYAHGCRTFFTAALGEAVALKQLAPDARFYALNGPTAADAGLYARHSISPTLNSLSQIGLWAGTGADLPVALHIDTGMSRLGLPVDQAQLAAAALTGEKVDLVMSHLANASDPFDAMNMRQRDLFKRVAQSSFPTAKLSLAATAGAAGGQFHEFDLVRPGLGLYGDNGLDDGDGRAFGAGRLSPVMRVEAPVLQVRDVHLGETVGYGATYKAPGTRRIATIAIGYADGYLRSSVGRGFGVLDGVRCPIIGRISMDLITLDVTDAGLKAREGVMVELLGPYAPLKQVAEAMQTAPYEVLTSLGAHLPRAYTGATI
jgi:alanine racemase